MSDSKPPAKAKAKRAPTSQPGTIRSRDLDAQALLHELRVHQVELEVQNEELRRARTEMELALQRYTELFDFAPLGYALVQSDSTITEINFAGAGILGLVRSTVRGLRFERLVPSSQRSAFVQCFATARASGDKQVLELELMRFSGETFTARMSLIPFLRAEPVILLAFEDVKARGLGDPR